MKPLYENWPSDNHEARLVEHDRNMNLSILRLMNDILLIGGSLKHATTMLDDLITATTEHGQLQHSTKGQSVCDKTIMNEEKQHGSSSRDAHADPATWR